MNPDERQALSAHFLSPMCIISGCCQSHGLRLPSHTWTLQNFLRLFCCLRCVWIGDSSFFFGLDESSPSPVSKALHIQGWLGLPPIGFHVFFKHPQTSQLSARVSSYDLPFFLFFQASFIWNGVDFPEFFLKYRKNCRKMHLEVMHQMITLACFQL